MARWPRMQPPRTAANTRVLTERLLRHRMRLIPGPSRGRFPTPSASRPAIATVLARRPYTPPPRGRDSRGNRRRPLSSPRERTARRRRRPHQRQGCALVRTCARGQSSARARRPGRRSPASVAPASLSSTRSASGSASSVSTNRPLGIASSTQNGEASIPVPGGYRHSEHADDSTRHYLRSSCAASPYLLAA